MDFKGNPFGPMPDLMAIAEDVLKVHAVCVETGRPAGYSYRKDSKEDLVLIGEKKNMNLSREAFKKKWLTKNLMPVKETVLKISIKNLKEILNF